jgi:hypothetical protein
MELVSLGSLRCLCCGALGFGFGIIDGNSSYDSLGATIVVGCFKNWSFLYDEALSGVGMNLYWRVEEVILELMLAEIFSDWAR